MQTDDRHPVELLAEEFSLRLRRGESPTIEEFVARLPEHAALLRQVLGPIDSMERVGSEALAKRQFESRIHQLAQAHPQLGDFRIVRQVGRGGMGIVYEAMQQSLNRRVALKVLTPGIAGSPEELRRFQLEATAVAQLHHTNIVPIFGVGQAEGLHFYAMQYIDGISLSDAIARLSYRLGKSQNRESLASPSRSDRSRWADASGVEGEQTLVSEVATSMSSPPDAQVQYSVKESAFQWEQCELSRSFGKPHEYVRVVARLGHALADALAHAHHQGIIHRDIKPGNLLLDSQGIWLTDFGVAKLSDEATLTRTGSLLGTLRYMAPEQFSGQADARSDIYSLGLTLHELLTCKPVFSGLTQARLLQTKTLGDLATAARDLQSCPRDLATIVLKACSSDSRARYPSAVELAEDLQRFLDDRPIRARRASAVERLVRWGRRNPSVAVLLAMVATTLVALVGVFAYGNYRLNLALADLQLAKQVVDDNVQAKSAALEVAEQQRTLARSNLTLAIEAFEEIMRNVGSRGGAEALSIELNDGEVAYGTGLVSEADAEVLRTLLSFFERFSAENATDLSAATAAANRRTGDVLSRLGRPGDAEVAYRQALDHCARLIERAAGDGAEPLDREVEQSILVDRLSIYNSLAQCAALRGDVDQALEHYRALFDLYEQTPVAADIDDAQFKYALALNSKNSLIVRMSLGPSRHFYRDGRGGLGTAGFLREAMNNARESVGDRNFRRMAAGLAAAGRQIHRDAKQNNARAVELLTALVKRQPARVDFALELAHAYREQARLARTELDQASATESFRNALELLEKLLEKHPDAPYLQFVYADAVSTLAPPQARRAGIPIQRAVQIAHTLARDYPQVPDYVALKAKTLLVRNDESSISQSVELSQRLVGDYPTLLHYRLILANALQRLASLKQGEGDVAGARKALNQAIGVLNEAAEPISAEGSDSELPWMVSLNIERLRQQVKALGED